MSNDKKTERKKARLRERIAELEQELTLSLQKKAAGPAINVAAFTNKIRELKAELAAL